MNPWRGLEGLPRDLWLICGAVLINRTGTMVLPFLVLYLTGSRGFSVAEAGFAVTLYGVGSLVTAPVAGALCDRIGSLPVIRGSLLLSGGLMILLPMAHGRQAILAAVLALAVAAEGVRPASMALVSESVPPGRQKAAFALHRLAINLGMSVGPAVGGLLAGISFPLIFLVDGATSIAAGLVLALVPLPAVAAARRVAEAARAGSSGEVGLAGRLRGELAAFSDRRLLLFLAAFLPALLVFFQHQASMPLYLVRDLGMNEAAYGLLFTVNTGLIILLEVPLNLAMSSWPYHRALPLGALLTGVGFGAMGLASGFSSVALTVVLWTFGEMILLPGASAWVAEIAPAGRSGAYMGLFVMTFSLAFATGPWIGAFVYERFGSGTLWGAAFLCGLLSAVMLLGIRERPGPHGLHSAPGNSAG
ncbi:MAG TPA: MFS transporter [Candidatus Polarisedimenticolia bacterium]|nr:MFS transporter [Candidatus Polarisedimenticolia bacterium]